MSIEAMAFVKTLEPTKKAKPTWHLLFVIAENTFNDSGRCLLGQEQLGYEAGRKSVRTVSRQLKVLQGEGLIERKPRFNCDGGRTFDEIEIKGFARWYKKQHPEKPEPGKTRIKPAKMSGGVAPEVGRTQDPDTPRTECRVGEVIPDTLAPGAYRTPVSGHTGQQVSGSYKESRTSPVQEDSPPNPRKRGREGSLDLLLEAVRQGVGRERVVDRFLAPLLRQRSFTAPHREYALGVIADWAKDFDDGVLDRALKGLLKGRNTKVFGKNIEDALKEARRLEKIAADGAAAARMLAEKEANDPRGPQRKQLATTLVNGDLGRRAAAEDWLVELWHWCREIGRLPVNAAEIARVIATRDALKAKNAEWDRSDLHRRWADTAREVRTRDSRRLRVMLGLPAAASEEAAA